MGLATCSRVLALFLVPGAPAAHNEVLFASDFEADGGGMLATVDWHHGPPSGGPGAAHSGANAWWVEDATDPFPEQFLTTPPIDASATDADWIEVSWYQYFEGFPVNFDVRARTSTQSQNVFRRLTIFDSGELPHVGWRRVAVLLPSSYATNDLELEFERGVGGVYIDDLAVEAVRSVTLSVEDFEADAGGFTAIGATWMRGAPENCHGFTGSAASGTSCWGTLLSECSYEGSPTEQILLAPPIDLSLYASHRAVYVTWQRFAFFEQADGVHHEISYDGGTTWETAAGWHWRAFGPGGLGDWTSFGIPLDPSDGQVVLLRWRMTLDEIESEPGMWIDDFAIAVPEEIDGSGANPPDSLRVAAGSVVLGDAVTLAIDDPSDAFGPFARTLLAISLQGDPALPDGTPLPGTSLSTPGAPGERLIDFAGSLVTVPGGVWTPAAPAMLTLDIPDDPGLAGLELYLQAVLIDLTANPVRIGLTNGLFEKVGS